MEPTAFLAVVLLCLALVLLVAEVFIPSGGMISILSLISLIASAICAFQAWWGDDRAVWWSYVAGVVVLIPSALIGAFYALPRTPFGKRVLLEPPTADEIAVFPEETERLEQLIGQVGRTQSVLNPSGLLLVDGERLHCETEGVMVDSGTEVRIVAVRGNRLLVREPLPDDGTRGGGGDDAPLDFDLQRH